MSDFATLQERSNHEPEHVLFRSVITRAFLDATVESRDWQVRADTNSARSWLLKGGRDFYFVCELADIDPSVVQGAAQRLAKAGWPRLPSDHVHALLVVKKHTGAGK